MTEQTPVDKLLAYDINGLVGAYKAVEAKIDTATERHAKELAPLKQTLQQIHGAITIKMDANGLENVRTEFGTAYFSNPELITVINKQDFLNWVIEHRATDVLTSNVSKDAIRERRDRGEEVPGLEIVPTRKLHIRKPS